mgnify:FL=1
MSTPSDTPTGTAAGKPGFIMLNDAFILNDMPKLSHRAVVALLVVLMHIDGNRRAYPSYQRIGQLIGTGWRTAKRAVEELVGAGVLIRTNRPGESSIYVVAEHVTPRGAKSGRGHVITPAKSGRGTPAKSDNPPLPNLTQEPYTENHTQLNQKKARAFLAPGFDDWYKTYPRRVKRPKAEKAYHKAAKSIMQADGCTVEAAAKKLLAAAQAFAESDVGRGEPRYIPYPATWLNAAEYNDDPKEWKRNSNGNGTPLTPGDGQRHPEDRNRARGML